MKKLQTEINIKASKENVWKVLMDWKMYPEWNPFIKEVEGEMKEGKRIKVVIQPPGKKKMSFNPVILTCKPNKEFRWKGKMFVKGLFDGEHYFLLEEIGPDQCKLIHGEVFTGLLSGVLYRMIGDDTKKGFELMNQALRDRFF